MKCCPGFITPYEDRVHADFGQALILEPTNKTASEGVKRLKKLLFE